MANLLLRENKKDLRKEYAFRRLTITALFLALVIFAGIVLLVPSYVLSHQKRVFNENELERVKEEARVEGIGEFENIINDVNKKLSILNNDEMAPGVVHQFMEDISLVDLPSIDIKNIFYDKTDDGAKISLQGTAETRDALTFFVNSLRNQEQFSEVLIPPSNFARKTDLNFSITINVLSAQ